MDSSDLMEGVVTFDGKERTIVRGGKKCPLTEEEWRLMNPEHKDAECNECAFVQDKETLFTFFVSRELKENASSDPVFVGNFCLPGWTTHSGFYVFKCPFCESVSVSSISGIRRLWCPTCQDHYRLNPVKHRDIILRGRNLSSETLKHFENKHRTELKRQRRDYLLSFLGL